MINFRTWKKNKRETGQILIKNPLHEKHFTVVIEK